jgi:hypothetical protein
VPSTLQSRDPKLELRQWVASYERAFETESISALKGLGVIRTAGQEDGIKRFFDSVEGLNVQISDVHIDLNGDEATVRFMRTDRDARCERNSAACPRPYEVRFELRRREKDWTAVG